MTPILQVYAQDQWHADLVIIGNKEGLQRLLKSVAFALVQEGNVLVRDPVCVSDGEGYDIEIRNLGNATLKDKRWSELAVPYTEPGTFDKEKQKPPYNSPTPQPIIFLDEYKGGK